MKNAGHAPSLDFFAVGEALIDFISSRAVGGLDQATAYHPYPGGQPSNLAAALAHLGRTSAIAACVGADGFGRRITDGLRRTGVKMDYIQITDRAATSTAYIGRSKTTPEFIILRGADAHLKATGAMEAAAAQTKVFHTSAFAISRAPSRATVLSLLETAVRSGALITFDPNYHPRVWPDRDDFKALVMQVLASADIVKPSLEDCCRLLGPERSPEDYVLELLDQGAANVVLTMGPDGVLLGFDGRVQGRLDAVFDRVEDVTGAGDAFWAGMIDATLDGRTIAAAACRGHVLAGEKLGYAGPLQPLADPAALQQRAEALCASLPDAIRI